jgi:membrane protease YdiL (CAAX protease family)
MGFALGGMYMYTGNVLAPILAHFTINFLNLSLIAQQAAERED